MKPARFGYLAPRSVPEVVCALESYGDCGKLLAGGQSLGPLLNLRLATPDVLIDLGSVPELAGDGMQTVDGVVTIPAMTAQRAVEISPMIRARSPMLAQALPWVAHKTIRNRGTIGGSLAHADPAAELPAVAVACGATIVLAGTAGRRRIPAAGFFDGYFTTVLDETEVVVAIDLPALVPGEGTAWVEFAPRRGDFAIVGVGARVRLSDVGVVEECTLAYSGVADRPWSDEAVAAGLLGQRPDAGAFAAAGERAGDLCRPASDTSGSADYRRSLMRSLTARALREACDNAGMGSTGGSTDGQSAQ